MDDREKLALQILRDALDSDGDERAQFLRDRCGADAALRARVESLLRGIAGTDIDLDEVDAHASRRAPDALIGTQLGAFRVLERIGRGGMGVVYRGERQDADFTQEVALKLIRRGFDFDDVHARFLRERRILAQLAHPHLARFIDGGVAADGRPWFALEYVRGESIMHWCDGRMLDVRARARLFLDVCAAVQYAHTQLVVHRDLKPANVLVDQRGAVRLLDFGIARLLGGDDDAGALHTTIDSRYALTPEYAAPEQFGGAPAGVATDVYALGTILYELVAGVLPYEIDRHDLAAAERTVRETLPQALGLAIQRGGDAASRLAARATTLRAYRHLVRGDLSRIIEKSLAKEPARRYATVEAFADDLARWLDGAPVRVSGNRLGYRAAKFVRRNRAAVAVAGVLALGLIGASAFALRNAWEAHVQRDESRAEAGRANAVREYVMLMFRDAAEQRDAAKLTAREVLKRGADAIFTQFSKEPKTGQATALMLGELYLMLNDIEGAAPMFERLLAWPGVEQQPDLLASARYDLAQVDYYRNQRPRAAALLQQAQTWWSAQPARYADKLSESRTLQSQLERADGKLDTSIATLQAGIAERRSTSASADRELGVALATLSVAFIQAGRYEDALHSADEATTIFGTLGLARTTTGLGALNNHGLAAMYLDHFDEASADFRAAVDLNRELFGSSIGLAIAQNNLALALVRKGDAPAALPLFDDALRMAIAQGGERGRAALMPRVNLAEAYAATGRTTDAAPLAEAAVEIATSDYGEKSLFAGAAFRARANVRVAQGRLDAARSDLHTAAEIFAAAGKGGEIYTKSLDGLRARLEPR
jgi:serine/threonine-protein kinase